MEEEDESRRIKEKQIDDDDEEGKMEEILLKKRIESNTKSNESKSNDNDNDNSGNNKDNNKVNNNDSNNDSDNVLSPISTGEIINREDMEMNTTKIKVLKNEIENYQITISKLSNELINSKEEFSLLKEIKDKESSEENK